MAVQLATVELLWPYHGGAVGAWSGAGFRGYGYRRGWGYPGWRLAAVGVGLAAAASYPYDDYGYGYGYNGYGYNSYGYNGYYGGKSCLQPQTVWNGWGYQRVWVEVC